MRRILRSLNRAVMETLESRLLLSYTWITEVADTGNATTNGAELQNVLNGITTHGGTPLELGDTIVLAAGAYYLAPTGPGNGGFNLTDITAGTGTITIESSDIYNGLGHLPANTRVGPSQSAYMPHLETNINNGPVILTSPSAHNYSLLGLEVLPISNTISGTNNLIQLGDGTSNQSSTSIVPTNFVVDRCYIHGWDAVSSTQVANLVRGIALNSANTTVENSYISDIHNTFQDAQAICGWNGTGPYTITNNYLEATGENVFFGGTDSSLGVGVDPNNITITHNYLFKPLTWDPFDPSYNLPTGVHYDVKNLFELKHATNVILDQNLLENNWVGADQVGEGIVIDPKNQSGGNTWMLINNVTITNNVIRNVQEGFQLWGSIPTTPTGFSTLPIQNEVIENNLVELDGAGGGGSGYGFAIGSKPVPGGNLTISNNTVFASNNSEESGISLPYGASWTDFTFTNNVVQYGQYGFFSTPGEGTTWLNTAMSGITVNGGSGYTAAPTVTFSAPPTGGTTATGTAQIGYSIVTITVTNGGSGYTSSPTINYSGGGNIGWCNAVANISGGAITSITINNPGGDFTGTPTLSFSGGGGTGATATAAIGNGAVVDVVMSNNGSSYTSAPTITFAGGLNSGGTAASATSQIIGGAVKGWNFAGNVIFGTTVNTTSYPSGNFFPASQDAVGFQSSGDELLGLASNSPYFTDGTGGSTPGVNFSALSGITDFKPTGNALTGYWKFDEDSGTTSADASGNSKTATLSTSTLWTTSGETKNAVTITSGNYVSVPTFSTTANFSFAAWINPSSLSAIQYIASTGNNAFSLWIDSTGHLNAKGTTGTTVTDSNALTTGQWYLVGVTFNGSTLTLYRSVTTNGATAMASVGSASATTTTGSTTLYLGDNSGSSSSFSGTIDEARYYNANISTPDLDGYTGLQRLFIDFAPQIGNFVNHFSGTITTPTVVDSAFAIGHGDSYTGSHVPPTNEIFHWSIISGPSGTTFSANNTNAAWTTTITFAASGSYILQLTVTDGRGGSYSDDVPMTVNLPGTVPAAPTNLVATPGTSTIALTWTDNSTNETGFHVWRSTDNATWGTAIATLGANTTAYTDSTPTAGTAYYYKVTSYNGSGDSTVTLGQNDITCEVATVLAYDGFNYASVTGTNPWSGGNTGLGFSGTWTLASTANATVPTGSLTYSSTGHALTTSANQVTLTRGDTATQTLSSAVGAAGSTLWAGVELEGSLSTLAYAEVDIGTSTNEVRFGLGALGGTGAIGARAVVGANTYSANAGQTAAINTVYFIACKIQYLTTGDIVTIFVNPQPGVTTPTGGTSVTLPATAQLTSTSTVVLSNNTSGTNISTFDELRLGVSYAAVAPDPFVPFTPTRPLLPPASVPILLTVSPTAALSLVFNSLLTAAPVPTVSIDLSVHTDSPSYHLFQDDPRGTDTFDSSADPADQLLLDV